MIRAATIGVCFALAAPCAVVSAAEDPAVAALAAAEALGQANIMLDEADTASDRVKALTQTIEAYESGLTALREGLRRAAIRQAAIEAELASQREEVARLLGVLEAMGRAPAPLLLLHPAGPVGTARAGMIVADFTPAMQERVDELRGKLEEVALLRSLQDAAADTLRDGLIGMQEARIRLTAAIQDRTDLPRRFSEDPVQTALLIASAETLDAFASGLGGAIIADDPDARPDASAQKGSLPLPLRGQIIRGFNAADAAGVVRPGIIIAARPRALVTTPTAATLRFRGPLLDYGNVVIVEPAADVLFILAGLAEVYGEVGEVLPAGSPLGLMGGETPPVDEILTDVSAGNGIRSTETLYLEVREGQSPVDPATWFAAE